MSRVWYVRTMRPAAAIPRLNQLALGTSEARRWREAALGVLRRVVSFDAGLFHEMSPRSPLDRAGLLDMSADWLEASRAHWDEMAVTFATLLHDAAEHDWVAIASRAFEGRRKLAAQWTRRVARPLNARDVAFVHLVAHERVIAAVFLVRKSGRFSETERASLAQLIPALTLGDALQQSSAPGSGGLRTRLECVDGRLTPRRRQIVEHIALGHTNQQIADALGISVHTVRNALVNIQARLGASNRAEVVHRSVFR